MTVYVVHYSYIDERNPEWHFVGLFSNETQAREWCEKQFITFEWRGAYCGEPKGLHIEGKGIRDFSPDWFNVMLVEVDYWIGTELS